MNLLLRIAFTLCLLASQLWAKDFGPSKDLNQIRQVVRAKYPHVANISVSNDWALCISNFEDSDLSVLLSRKTGKWKIIKADGGAFSAQDLVNAGVPKADHATLFKSYQQ